VRYLPYQIIQHDEFTENKLQKNHNNEEGASTQNNQEKVTPPGIPHQQNTNKEETLCSSAVEPEWGRTRKKTLQELQDEWQAWETTTTKKTTDEVVKEWEAWNTPTYRHGRPPLLQAIVHDIDGLQ
jgi:hypothetical protein